jgi:hypothetical protein
MVTDRDISILRLINQFGFSAPSIIQETLFKNLKTDSSKVTSRRRIQYLHEIGFLRKQINHLSQERIYTLTPTGCQFLADQGFEELRSLEKLNWGEFRHDLEIQKIYLRFRELGFTKFYSERKAKEESPFGDLVPDLIMFNQENKAVMIEVELTRKTFKRMEEKLKQYVESPYMISLLYICQSDAIVKAISQTAKKFDELEGRFFGISLKEFHSKSSTDYLLQVMKGELC